MTHRGGSRQIAATVVSGLTARFKGREGERARQGERKRERERERERESERARYKEKEERGEGAQAGKQTERISAQDIKQVQSNN